MVRKLLSYDRRRRNGIWTATLSLLAGTHEYKYTLDGWNYQEEFVPGQSCTSTLDGFTNRTLTFQTDTVLPAFCWESCEGCSDEPGCIIWYADNYNPLATMDDGSCIVGGCTDAMGHNYDEAATYDNGTCIYCQEPCLIGCTDSTACNFDSEATEDDGSCDYSTCPGCTDPTANNFDSSATEDDGSCNYPSANVTFQVDMSQYSENYEFGGVYLNGGFNGWCGSCYPMTDDDGNGIWTATLSLLAGTHEYKYTLDGWNYQEEFVPGQSCTSTLDGFTNRTLTFQTDTVLPAFCWSSCDPCQVGEQVLGCADPLHPTTMSLRRWMTVLVWIGRVRTRITHFGGSRAEWNHGPDAECVSHLREHVWCRGSAEWGVWLFAIRIESRGSCWRLEF